MLQLIFVCALFAYGMFTIQRPGFLLAGLRNVWRLFPASLHETLFECGICVASLWGGGSYLYLLLVHQFISPHYRPYFWLPVAIISMSGICAFIDRAVKAFEKHYGYKPAVKSKGEDKWKYLFPYSELRKMMVQQFVTDNIDRNTFVVEIGGSNSKYSSSVYYISYSDATGKLHEKEIIRLIQQFNQTKGKYSVVILGLAYEGNLRALKKLIAHSQASLIEYSDDGISRQQIELLTEGIKTKLLIPEYTINVDPKDAPAKCGSVEKRKVIILQP
jgi:hypothetical protein